MRRSSSSSQFILPPMSLSKEMIMRSAFLLCSIDIRCGDSTRFRVLNNSQAAVDSEQLTLGSIIFNIYSDISQAKFCLQSVNIGEGALRFRGGTAPFGPHGYGPAAWSRLHHWFCCVSSLSSPVLLPAEKTPFAESSRLRQEETWRRKISRPSQRGGGAWHNGPPKYATELQFDRNFIVKLVTE
jgi:hypothetical protein